jgi:hypothetical protein
VNILSSYSTKKTTIKDKSKNKKCAESKNGERKEVKKQTPRTHPP